MTTQEQMDMILTVLTPIAIMLAVALLMQIVTGVLCHKLAKRKGYKRYFFTGFFFGVIGLIYVVGLPDLNARKDARLVMKRMVNLHERVSALEEGEER